MMDEVNASVEKSTFGDLDVLSALKEQMEGGPSEEEAPKKKVAKKAAKKDAPAEEAPADEAPAQEDGPADEAASEADADDTKE